MISLTDYIKVIVIRTAAGIGPGPVDARCSDKSITYYINDKLNMRSSSKCGNFQELYDPAKPRKVINVMNFCGAPASEFFAFNRSNLTDALDLQSELNQGDEIICLWKPLFGLDPNLWLTGLNQRVLPDATS